jgi:hypothetical protein
MDPSVTRAERAAEVSHTGRVTGRIPSSLLKDEPNRQVVRSGTTVARPTGWWTPTVHTLLRHLEACAFPYSPRVIESHQPNREVLTYIPGRSGKESWVRVVDLRGLERFAALLRRYHDAVRSFRPPPGSTWAFTNAAPRDTDLICHGDFGPWNIVWRGLQPVGILDWDFAGPGPAPDDVAYALEYAVPFRDDATAVRSLGYPQPPDRRKRMAVFAEAYGLSDTKGLVENVACRQRLDIARVQMLAERGLEPQVTWVQQGYLSELEARVAWTEKNFSLFAE